MSSGAIALSSGPCDTCITLLLLLLLLFIITTIIAIYNTTHYSSFHFLFHYPPCNPNTESLKIGNSFWRDEKTGAMTSVDSHLGRSSNGSHIQHNPSQKSRSTAHEQNAFFSQWISSSRLLMMSAILLKASRAASFTCDFHQSAISSA